MADTRKDKRAPVSLKVRFKSATVDEFIEHYSKDVSRGGLYIKSSQPMAVGTLLKFQFQLKDESALIRGVGRVVWTRVEEDAAADQPAGMGIKFIKMDNDSRAMVERIVDAHAPDQGTYESGRYNATSAEPTISSPPAPEPTQGGSFFPDLPPAELPPPEDRTAVRQATEFLAAALTEGGTDSSATQEAQQKAEEARRRTEEVEAQRREEAEAKKKQEAEARNAPRPKPVEPEVDPSPGSLPSMIIDPTLEPRKGRPSEQTVSADVTPLPRPNVAVLDARAAAAAAHEPDTEPPPAREVPRAPTTSIPDRTAVPRRSQLPWLVLAAVLVVAAFAFVRGVGRDSESTALSDEQQDESLREVAAQPPPPPPAVEAPAPMPEAEQAVTAERPTNAADAQVTAAEGNAKAEVELVSVEVATTPRGADVWIGEEKRGSAPVSLELPAGVPVLVRASAPGHSEAREELTPSKKVASLKLKLKPLAYLVHVESTPPGVAVNVAGHKGVAPVDLTLDDPPAGELSVTGKFEGYESTHMRLKPEAFSETDGAMHARLSLTLQPKLPTAVEPTKEATPRVSKDRPKKAAPAKKRASEPAAAGATGESAATHESPAAPDKQAELAAPEPAKPEPVKPDPPKAEPAKAEPLPGNPFGE